ncbi:FecR family protein [Puia sp. P3]|uniref:FecR family protein n=1 Tax=Puia sp. P3 TaxID=3423952 RepID=UPI003D66AE25
MQNPDYEDVVKECLLQLMQTADESAQPGGDRILQNILSVDKTAGQPAETRGGPFFFLRRPLVKRFAAAAVVLVAIAGTWFFLHTPKSTPAVATVPPKATTIKPGTNRAILTPANGQQIVLDDAQKGVLGQQGKTRVIKLDSGQLAYADADGPNAGAAGNPAGTGNPGTAGTNAGTAGNQAGTPGTTAILFNTIATPRGGQYQVTLPDHTRVWLNAESSLRFPTAFTGKQRTVELTGEAYFEVAPNKNQPFLVRAGSTETRVLGTQFNVMAYGDEGPVKTTLLEGSVQMGRGQANALLVPGQQGQWDAAAGKMATRMVNTRQVTAWKDGYYYFDRTPVQSVMRQIARWYDVKIVYQGQAPKDEIVGKIPRTADVSEVLHVMELIGIRFKIEGRTITVLT